MRSKTTKERTVLIAEDETEIRDLLSLMFQVEGFLVLTAADGQTALDIVRSNNEDIDLLVTDLGLPKLGGMELIRSARTHLPSMKIIAASGFGHANVRSELRKLGVEEFFPKPFSPGELLATAKRLLASE